MPADRQPDPTYPAGEPLLHTSYLDGLPEEHPWARKTVLCGNCNEMVHAFNNEMMQPWLEWQELVLCFDCALPIIAADCDWPVFKRLATAGKEPSIDPGE